VQIMTTIRRCMLCDTMGLGKTATTIKAIEGLNGTPALIVGTKNSLGVWKREIEEWLEQECIIYSGERARRLKEWSRFKKCSVPFVITNYAFVEEICELQSNWVTVVADEIHKSGLLNRKTKTFKAFKKLSSKNMFLVTGTPIRQTPADLWAPLNLLYPKIFTSYWKFVNKYCIVIKDKFGSTIERRPKDVMQFRIDIRDKYIIRRTKDQVLHDLPSKTRTSIPIDMTPVQKRLYEQLAEQMLAESNGRLVIAPNAVSRDLKLRQLLVSPMLLGIDDKGAALSSIKDLVQDEYLEGNSVAVFTPFRAAVDLIAEELQSISDLIITVKGGMSAKELFETTQRFQKAPTAKKALVATIKSSTSFDAYAASAAYFIGYEWSYDDNEQAEDRLHRIGQKKHVRCYYIINNGTLDEYIMQAVSSKFVASGLVLLPEHLLPERYKRKKKLKFTVDCTIKI